MNVIEKDIEDLKPYKKNARLNDDAVEVVANSIKEFGFRVPILIEKDGTIVAGHTRFKACKKLHIQKVPCIVVDDLTEEQIKAYRLADNKVSEKAEWDFSLLDEELSQIVDINMADFGFDFELDEQEEEDKPKEEKTNQRERTCKAYNLEYFDKTRCEGLYEMPTIMGSKFVPDSLIGFNYVRSSKVFDCGIHFYVDDYQFERIWNDPEENIKLLTRFDCVLTPDFSLYLNMPLSMMIWNTYRSRLIGQMMEDEGIQVIPTVSWADERSFDFCFDGLPTNKVVSISTIGVKRSEESLEIYKRGVKELMKRKNPNCILLYGGFVEADYGSAKIKEFKNTVTERMKNNGR